MSEGYLSSREKLSTEIEILKEAKFGWGFFFSIMEAIARGGKKPIECVSSQYQRGYLGIAQSKTRCCRKAT